MTARSITMTAEEAFLCFDKEARAKGLTAALDWLRAEESAAALAVAIEAERRLLAKLAEVPVERLAAVVWAVHHGYGTHAGEAAEAVRAELLRAVRSGSDD